MNADATAASSPPAEPVVFARDAQGRFLPGCAAGPGNPFNREIAAMRKAVVSCLTHEEIQNVFRALYKKACEGNVPAAKVILEYAVGKPGKAVDPDRMNIEEWQGHKETAGMMAEAASVQTAPNPEYPLQTTRISRAAVTASMSEMTTQFIENPELLDQIEKQQEEEARAILEREATARGHIEVRPGVEEESTEESQDGRRANRGNGQRSSTEGPFAERKATMGPRRANGGNGCYAGPVNGVNGVPDDPALIAILGERLRQAPLG